jgi:hypothetical protein
MAIPRQAQTAPAPQAAPPPAPPSWAAQAGETVANAFRKPRETLEGWGKSAGEFFNNLKTGNIIGGVLGMVGAWLIGSMFAAGPFQIILSLLLLPLGFILGSHAAGASNDVAPLAEQSSPNHHSSQPQRGVGQLRVGEVTHGVAGFPTANLANGTSLSPFPGGQGQARTR